MAGIHIRCYGNYENDRICDLCAMVNSDIAHACKRKALYKDIDEENNF